MMSSFTNRLKIIGFSILLISVTYISGCIDDSSENQNGKTSATLEDFILKTSDLDEGYIITTIDRNQSDQIGFTSEIASTDILGLTYTYDSGENETSEPFIAATIAQYISFKDAKDAMSYSEFVMAQTISSLFNDSGQTFTISMADSSLGRLYDGQLNETYEFENASWTYLFSRINKTLFFISIHKISPDEDYQFQQKTIDLMEIMLTRFKELS